MLNPKSEESFTKSNHAFIVGVTLKMLKIATVFKLAKCLTLFTSDTVKPVLEATCSKTDKTFNTKHHYPHNVMKMNKSKFQLHSYCIDKYNINLSFIIGIMAYSSDVK
jgi:hypothetical protein